MKNPHKYPLENIANKRLNFGPPCSRKRPTSCTAWH